MASNVRPIDWHRECLHNMEDSLRREERILARQLSFVVRFRETVERYLEQIMRAEQMGKAAFDRDRFGVKRAKPAGAKE